MKIVVKNEFIEYIVSFLIFLTIPPYFVWGYNRIELLAVILILLCSFIRNRVGNLKHFGFCFVLYVLYALFALRDSQGVFGILVRGLPCFIFLFPYDYLSNIFKKFSAVYAVILIPSIIVYIVLVFVGLSLPSQIISPMNSAKSIDYLQFPFLLVPSNTNIVDMFRFMALFDEPGVVGTISGVLLFVRGIRLKDWIIYPILISGILSFSLAFYLLFFVYILFYQSIGAKVITVLVLIFLAFYFGENDFVQEKIFERLQIEDGQLTGMNRTQISMDNFMRDFKNRDEYWFGYGNNYAQNVVNKGGASYKDLIVNYGIIGFSFFVIISLALGIKELGLSKGFIIYFISFWAIIYQRPFIFSPIYLFLIYSPIFYIKQVRNLNNTL